MILPVNRNCKQHVAGVYVLEAEYGFAQKPAEDGEAYGKTKRV